MRPIVQGREPAKLRKWKRDNKSTPQNLVYGNIPQEIKNELKSKLLEEQGGICAYTMCRLDEITDCHIEHIEPQNTKPEKSLDYSNMAACFPKDGGDTSSGYGAPVKGGKPVNINVNFISPHSLECDKRFRFDSVGAIHPVDNHIAARKTIDLLCLDNPILRELRQAALAAHGLTLIQRNLRKRTPRLTAAEAANLANRIVKPTPGGTQLEPFCIAISQVAKTYAMQEKARSRRKRKEK